MNDKSAATWESFNVPAMDCAEEFRMISDVLGRVPGIGELRADYLNRELRVELQSGVSRDDISSHLRQMGFPEQTTPLDADGAVAPQTRMSVRQFCVLAGMLLLLAASVLYFNQSTRYVARYVAAVAAVLAGVPVCRAAWRAVRLGRIEMNGLMVIAGTGAIALGDTFEAAVAMVLFGLSNWLEEMSLSRARRAVTSLANLMPKLAHKIHGEIAESATESTAGCDSHGADGSFHVHDVLLEQLAVGDNVLVRAGERVPVDGVVMTGNAAVDQSPITGESLPVDVAPGDSVFAGSLNGDGSLIVQVTGSADDSTLAHVGRLVDQARADQSPTERFVDRFARWYTPIVIGFACLLVLLGPLVAGETGYLQGFGQWLHRGLVLLVIACPCALVISTPITIICGLHRATRMGMLVKGGEHIENAAKTTLVVVDKTGTLTTGNLTIAEVLPVEGASRRDVLAIAAGLEQHSEHPIATAIRNAAGQENVEGKNFADVHTVQGRGVHGRHDNDVVAAGKVALFDDLGLPIPDAIRTRIQEAESGLVVAVGMSSGFVGCIRLADTVRAESQRAITQLRESGVQSITMLSGDRQIEADRVAGLVGITKAHGGLLPADKIAHIRRLKEPSQFLMMVGDGVNDAPSLAEASLGVALGKSSSDLAIESSDVVILSPNLERVADLIHLSRSTNRVLWQNIVFAIGVKLLVLLLAVAGAATMWMAVAADVGASMVVIFNGMRLLSMRMRNSERTA